MMIDKKENYEVWMKLHKRILDPSSAEQQLSAVRGIILLLETDSFRQCMSVECCEYLNIVYRDFERRIQIERIKEGIQNGGQRTLKIKSKFSKEKINEIVWKNKPKVSFATLQQLKDTINHAFINTTNNISKSGGESLSSSATASANSVDPSFNFEEFVRSMMKDSVVSGTESTSPDDMLQDSTPKNDNFPSFSSAKAEYIKDKVKDGVSKEDVEKELEKTKKQDNEKSSSNSSKKPSEVDEVLAACGIESRLGELIVNEIMESKPNVQWDDIAGLEFAKQTVIEMVVWPLLRPDIFKNLREPPKGVLLFGPPGTGKTLIGKCIASQANATFFSISASSITSKWQGESEKLVRALFAVARKKQPSVVFIDEIDSLLTQRSSSENESSRRIKTEFLVQLDGANTSSNDKVLILGATNRPEELDEAARRRLVKRLYIPLPDRSGRLKMINNLLSKLKHSLSDKEVDEVASLTEGKLTLLSPDR